MAVIGLKVLPVEGGDALKINVEPAKQNISQGD